MTKTMMLAPAEGATSEALALAARAAGWKVLAAQRSTTETGVTGRSRLELGKSAFDAGLPWNPASYVSAGALALGAASQAEVETLVIVSAPERGERSLFDGPPAALASAVEEASLGPLWLAREYLRRFEARRGGRILLLSVEAPGEEGGDGTWASFATASFRGFGEALFERGRAASWKAWGVVDKGGKPEALAAFALALLEEGKEAKAGRWLAFGGKPGLFGIF